LQARIAAALDRVQAELQQIAANESLPKGKSPDDETTKRQVEWFYRHRLCGESINKIARTDLYDRATVRHGVREAERILNLAAYRWE
jgi:hypothetical protein